MGKQPRALGALRASRRGRRLPSETGHHRRRLGDGLVLLVRIDDGAEILAKKPGNSPVTALAWSADGMLLAFGTESGEAGIIDLA